MTNTSNNKYYSFDTCNQYAEDGNYKYYGSQNKDTNNNGWCVASNDLTTSQKYGVANNCSKDSLGNYMGGGWSNAIYSTDGSGTYYVILQWRLLFQYKKSNKQIEVQNQLDIVIKWIKIFNASSSLFVIGYFILITLALNVPNLFYTSTGMIIPGLCLSISFFVISSYLLINPYVLSGLPFIKYKEIESDLLENGRSEVLFIETDYSNEIKLIDDYFIQKQSFLKQGLTLAIVAVELNIPVRELSYIINNYYTTRFNDFVNKYRVDYILQKVGKSYLDIYTLESLSKEAGFTHKSSFYRAFKRIHNVSISEYLEN